MQDRLVSEVAGRVSTGLAALKGALRVEREIAGGGAEERAAPLRRASAGRPGMRIPPADLDLASLDRDAPRGTYLDLLV